MAKTVEEFKDKIAEALNLNPVFINRIDAYDVETEEGYQTTYPSFYYLGKKYVTDYKEARTIKEFLKLICLKRVRII